MYSKVFVVLVIINEYEDVSLNLSPSLVDREREIAEWLATMVEGDLDIQLLLTDGVAIHKQDIIDALSRVMTLVSFFSSFFFFFFFFFF